MLIYYEIPTSLLDIKCMNTSLLLELPLLRKLFHTYQCSLITMGAPHPMLTLSKVLGDMKVLGDRIDWIRLWFTGGIPILAVIIGSLWVPLQSRTAIFASIYATVSGISVTAGKLNSSLPSWVFA
jgi:hypothetical protein